MDVCIQYRKVITNQEDLFIIFYTDVNKCMYSKKALALLVKNNLKFRAFNINNEDKSTLFYCLTDMIKYHNTMPVIFYQGKFIGGYAELKKFYHGS
jgi:glutaredoxin